MTETQWKELHQHAQTVRERAYAPYSKFLVGAALLSRQGNVYLGCNVENGAYSPCLCAERGAVAAAVAAGEREFVAVAIVATDLASPCGVCRQVLFEFGADIAVRAYAADAPDIYKTWTSGELLPDGFELKRRT
jgi:cytidine deaminase